MEATPASRTTSRAFTAVFGWSAEDTRQILGHEERLIAVGFEGEGERREVVSAGIAELSRIDLGDGVPLRIVELTEAATLKTHQGRGLYSAICATLMLELATAPALARSTAALSTWPSANRAATTSA